MAVTHTCVQCNLHTHTSGIIRKNSVSGSSSGSQERTSKGVTFATDYARIVSVITDLLFTFIDYYLSAPSAPLFFFFFGLFFTPINGILILDARCTDLPFYLSNSDLICWGALWPPYYSCYGLKWQHCVLMKLHVWAHVCRTKSVFFTGCDVNILTSIPLLSILRMTCLSSELSKETRHL